MGYYTDEEERREEQRCLNEFKKEVNFYMLLGAKTRKDALRWMTQQEEFSHEQCVEHWVWHRGILFTEYGRKVVKEICDVVTFKEGYWSDVR